MAHLLWPFVPHSENVFYCLDLYVFTFSHSWSDCSSGVVFDRIKVVVVRSGPTFETSCCSHLAVHTTAVNAKRAADCIGHRNTRLGLKESEGMDSFAAVLSRCIPTTSKVGFVEIFALDKSARIFILPNNSSYWSFSNVRCSPGRYIRCCLEVSGCELRTALGNDRRRPTLARHV